MEHNAGETTPGRVLIYWIMATLQMYIPYIFHFFFVFIYWEKRGGGRESVHEEKGEKEREKADLPFTGSLCKCSQ